MVLPELVTIHDTYLTLSRIATDSFASTLGGKLLLRSRFDAQGVAVVVAGSVAGAATLCIDGDGNALRAGLRAGLCDFVVAHLEEALRILKNEIRRGLPVSVGLTADPDRTIAAMIERGVQPDLLSAEHLDPDPAEVFVQRGTVVLPSLDPPGADTVPLTWSVATDPARAMPRIRAIAAGVLDPERADTPARRRWLESAPRFLGRAFGTRHCVRMTHPEASVFVERMREEFPTAAVTRTGAAG